MVGELRFHKLCSTTKKKFLKEERKKENKKIKRKKLEKAVYQGAQVPKQGGEARSQRL